MAEVLFSLAPLTPLGSSLEGQNGRQQGSHPSIHPHSLGVECPHGLLRRSHCRRRSRQVHSRSQGNGQNHPERITVNRFITVGDHHERFAPHHQRRSHHIEVDEREQRGGEDHVRFGSHPGPGGGRRNNEVSLRSSSKPQCGGARRRVVA